MQFIEVVIDAVDILLLTAADAIGSRLEADLEVLRKITRERPEILRKFRESYFPEGTDVLRREAAGLLNIGKQFEDIVRLAGQYEALLSLGWRTPRFALLLASIPFGETSRTVA